jgi:hypothetical protein
MTVREFGRVCKTGRRNATHFPAVLAACVCKTRRRNATHFPAVVVACVCKTRRRNATIFVPVVLPIRARSFKAIPVEEP